MPSKELIALAANAMEERRKELISQPLSRIYPQLAEAAAAAIRAALQELDANQEQIGFREAFDSFQMLDGEPFLQTDVAQRVFSAVLAASALGEQSDG
ncbi:hypothetical protein [Brucella sp.]|uniref:hypothetical protein n=1 Tax=Brucella sp. TaxID=52132 RepID=UPI0028ADA6CA|nr:hypothetical protein [Brucella sp.]